MQNWKISVMKAQQSQDGKVKLGCSRRLGWHTGATCSRPKPKVSQVMFFLVLQCNTIRQISKP